MLISKEAASIQMNQFSFTGDISTCTYRWQLLSVFVDGCKELSSGATNKYPELGMLEVKHWDPLSSKSFRGSHHPPDVQL